MHLPFRFRIALFSAGISGVVLVALGAAAWLLVSRQKQESVDTEIRALGARHPGWFTARGNYQRLNESLAFIFGDAHEHEIILLAKDTNGVVLHTSTGWPPDLDPAQLDCQLADDPTALISLPANRDPAGAGMGRGRGGMGRGLGPGGGGGMVSFTKLPRFQTVITSRGEWRLGMLGTADTTLVIGLNYGPIRAELDQLRNAFLGVWLVALALLGWGGWWVAGRALRPMRAIAVTAERITASGLGQRIPDAPADPEINRVIQVLNRMMDRLEASFQQATRFSADASHELKTPLAVMQGELENALQSAGPGSPEQQFFTNLLEETQRLKTITRSLLLLAQADAGQLKLAREPLELGALLAELVEDARVLAADSHLSFELQLPAGMGVRADRALLPNALLNLLSNATKYNVAGGRVAVQLARVAERAVITIGNTGPGIPRAEQDRVFDRFFRVQRSDSGAREGIGLGLSLAREIIRAHGGDLSLAESRPGWTCFQVELPLNANVLQAGRGDRRTDPAALN